MIMLDTNSIMDASINFNEVPDIALLEKKSISTIKMKPTSFKPQPDPEVCLICQECFEDGHRITMCEQCNIHLHYRCQLEWLYFYNPVWNRCCCHCKQKWKADYSTIQIVKGENDATNLNSASQKKPTQKD